MSTFVKKATSVVASLAIVSSIVTPLAGVSANYTSLEAANELATLGVIVDQSANPADYNLGNNLLRREAVKVMMNLSDIAVVDNCDGTFGDLQAGDWACKYAETALANGLVAGNPNFRPNDLVSKIEGLKMMFQARDLEREENADWRAGYVNTALEMGIINSAFVDYNTPVTRGQLFIWGAQALDASMDDDDDDLLCEILGTCDDDDDNNDDDNNDDDNNDDTPVVGGDLEITLSPMTPASATVPGGVNGLRVAAYDVSAGSDDVVLNQVTLRRTGLSDEDTLTAVAVFTEDGRVSNSRSFNQENDTEAQINLDNGGLVVEAGEVTTMYVVVDVNTAAEAESDEFAIELVDLQSNAGSVDLSGNLRGNTFRVGSVDASEIVITPGGTVSDPNLGEQAADIFEFDIEGADDEDVVLQSITFEANGDAEDNLRNFELRMGNDVVATTTMMSGDYLTFVIDGGLEIEEDQNEDFTVTADVVDGAGDDIQFRIDEALDVQADSTTFGFGASADIDAVDTFGDLGTITIEAGELTFIEVAAPNDEIREDKDNVVLGGFQIVNAANETLEMEEFGVILDVENTASGSVEASTIFDDVELYNVDTGSSYELDDEGLTAEGNVFSDNSIDAILSSGTSNWEVRVDTVEDIANFNTFSIDMTINIDRDVTIIETMDDERVTDITPSVISYNTIDGSESGAQASLNPLADIDVVRGAEDVLALSFEVEAEDVSSVTIEEITVDVLTTLSGAANRQQVSEITLLNDGVEVDSVSGSDIGTSGDVTFDDMNDVVVAANGTTDFEVLLSFVDSDDATNAGTYAVTVTDIDAEDDERDDIVVNGLPLTSARDITVNEAGTIQTLAFDTANEDNEFDKLLLAGNSGVIASYDVRADNEEIDVEEVTFTLDGTANARDVFESATLLLDGVAVETSSNSDIVQGAGTVFTIEFEDIDGLIIPETTSELALQLNSANIGEDFTGETTIGVQVTNVQFAEAEGVESGNQLTNAEANPTADVDDSRTLDVVPAVVTPAVVSTLGTDDQTSELRLVVDGGDNTSPTGDAVQAELTELSIVVSSFQGTAGTLTVFNGNGVEVGTAAVAGDGTVDITIDNPAVATPAGDAIGNDNEVYRIEATAEAVYRLSRDGVTYSVNGAGSIETKLENTLLLGQYADSN